MPDTQNPKANRLKKRSFAIAGHRTSVALEPEFWAALETEARAKRLALTALIAYRWRRFFWT